MQRDFPRRILDSQDPLDTGARGCRGTSPGGSQTVKILRTMVPGGAEGLSQEDPRLTGSSGHWCQGVQRDFPRRIPDCQDSPDNGARGVQRDFPRRIPDSQDPPDTRVRHYSAGTFPGGSIFFRVSRDLAKRIPDSQDPHSRRLEQEDPRCDGIVLLESWTLHGDGIVLLGSWIRILGDCPTGIQDSCRQPWTYEWNLKDPWWSQNQTWANGRVMV